MLPAARRCGQPCSLEATPGPPPWLERVLFQLGRAETIWVDEAVARSRYSAGLGKPSGVFHRRVCSITRRPRSQSGHWVRPGSGRRAWRSWRYARRWWGWVAGGCRSSSGLRFALQRTRNFFAICISSAFPPAWRAPPSAGQSTTGRRRSVAVSISRRQLLAPPPIPSSRPLKREIHHPVPGLSSKPGKKSTGQPPSLPGKRCLPWLSRSDRIAAFGLEGQPGSSVPDHGPPGHEAPTLIGHQPIPAPLSGCCGGCRSRCRRCVG